VIALGAAPGHAARSLLAAGAGDLDADPVSFPGVKASATYASGRPGEIAVERHWVPIFVRCTKPTVVVQERQQPEQTAFLPEHHQQAQVLDALASQEFAAAER
jgi:hypothetical protein